MVKSDLYFKEMTVWWRMNLKGSKTGHARYMRGPKAMRAGNEEERTNSTTASGKIREPCLFFFKDFIFLFIHETHTHREKQRHSRGRSRLHRELDAGLDPGTPGSCPRPKAGAKPLSHPGIPENLV